MTRQYINVGDLEVAVKHAKAAVINDGDLGLLLNLLRCGDCPSGAAEPAADLLEGKITKPKHRPRKRAPGAPDEEKVRIALHVIGLESAGAVRKNAVADTAKLFKCSERKVREALTSCKLT